MKRIVIAAMLSLLGTPVLAAQCNASKTIEEAFQTDGITEVQLNVLAGYLEVRASDDDAISFRGRACTSDDEWLRYMSVATDDRNGILEITVTIPYQEDDFDPDYAYMDVDFFLPNSLPLEVRDSSGDVYIRGISLRMIDDSSGDIRMYDLSGPLSVNDSSGDVEIRDIQGAVEIADSSGDIEIEDVIGSVRIIRDSSGDIEIDRVSEDVIIERDSSGNIDIANVKQNVEVGSDGSGEIEIRSVDGGVRIGSDGSGNVSIANVGGDLRMEAKGAGTVRTRNVKGEVSIP